MNHFLGRQFEPIRYLRLACFAASKRAACVDEVGTRSSVDGAVDAAAAEERFVCGVDDGVGGELGDVAFYDGDFVVVGGIWGVEGVGGGVEGETVELVEEGEGGDLVELDGGGHFWGVSFGDSMGVVLGYSTER